MLQDARGSVGCTEQKQSAMGQYNPNRMKYQLEKLEKVDQLMSIWGIYDEQFVDQINLVF